MIINENPRIAYLILASPNREHERDLLAQSQTWANQVHENIFWLRGSDSSSFKLVGRELFVPCKEEYENILKKTLLGISWSIQHLEFDFVLRTNVSTYVDKRRLNKFIKDKEMTSNSVAGYPEYLKKRENIGVEEKETFLSGSGILIARNIALEMTKSEDLFSDPSPDDVAISRFFRKIGIEPVYLPRSNLHSVHLYTPAPFVRCKSSTNEFAASNRMKLVHRIITSPCWMKPILYLELLSFEFYLLSFDPKRLPDEILRCLAQIKRNLSLREKS